MKRIFTFAVNNGGTMTLVQVDDDGPVTLSSSNDPEVHHIPAGDIVITATIKEYIPFSIIVFYISVAYECGFCFVIHIPCKERIIR